MIHNRKDKSRKRSYFLTKDVMRLWNSVAQVIREGKNLIGFQRARTLKGKLRLLTTENKSTE